MQKVTTASGKEFEVSWAGVATIDGVLRFAVKNSDMSTIFLTFSDPDETATITHSFDNTPKEYTGFTVFRGVTLNYQDEIIVALSRI